MSLLLLALASNPAQAWSAIQVPPFYRYLPPHSCWQAETCPLGEAEVFKLWMPLDMCAFLRQDFDNAMHDSLALVALRPATSSDGDGAVSP